jgi:two-component sensor histidine kinase
MLDRSQEGTVRRIATPFAVTALGAFMLIAIVVVASLLVWQNYRAALAAGEAHAKASAHVVAAHVEWMLEASDQALRRIDAALGPEPVNILDGDIAPIHSAAGDLPDEFQYSVYDEAGLLKMSSVPEAVGVAVADREYFQVLSEGETTVVSPQLTERLSGEQVFVVARRITRAGVFRGAATIGIPTRAMDEFWSAMELGPNSTISLVGADGWVVARHPQLENAIDLSGTQLFTKHLPANSSGVYHSAVSPADGLSRIVGYRRVPNWPLVATTGVERGEALQQFWAGVRLRLPVGLPVIALLAVGFVWISRLLRADAARRIELEQALERNRHLFREIHHRVKNNLQAVSSLVQLQPMPEDSKEAMRLRIAAMVAVHEHIYGSDQFDRVEFAPYVERLVREIAAGYPSEVQIDTALEPVSVGRDQTLPLGLIINEIVSNAFKHAFSIDGTGQLFVGLDRTDTGAQIVIRNSGAGYVPDQSKRGMGSRLIAAFVGQIGGTLDVEGGDGTTVTVTFQLQ